MFTCRPRSETHSGGFLLKCRNKSPFTFSVTCKRQRIPQRTNCHGFIDNFADFSSTPAAVTAEVTELPGLQDLVKCCTCKKKSNLFHNCQVFLSRRTFHFYSYTPPVGESDVSEDNANWSSDTGQTRSGRFSWWTTLNKEKTLLSGLIASDQTNVGVKPRKHEFLWTQVLKQVLKQTLTSAHFSLVCFIITRHSHIDLRPSSIQKSSIWMCLSDNIVSTLNVSYTTYPPAPACTTASSMCGQ